MKVTQGVHRHVDMIISRILDLKSRNTQKLEVGDVTMKDIVTTAGMKMRLGG